MVLRHTVWLDAGGCSMSTEHSRECDLGLGYRVEFTFKDGAFTCVWDPEMPPREIGKMLIPAYKRERDAFFREAGIGVLVVDL